MLTTATRVPGAAVGAGAVADACCTGGRVPGGWAAAQPAQATKPHSALRPVRRAMVFFTRPTPCPGLRRVRGAAWRRGEGRPRPAARAPLVTQRPAAVNARIENDGTTGRRDD